MATKVIFKPNPQSSIQFEVVAERDVDLFQKIARLQDVFGEKECGLCHHPDIRYVARKARTKEGKEFTYHELVCQKCKGHLPFGQHNNNEGTLFAKRHENVNTGGWIPAVGKTNAPNRPLAQAKPVVTEFVPEDLVEEDTPF